MRFTATARQTKKEFCSTQSKATTKDETDQKFAVAPEERFAGRRGSRAKRFVLTGYDRNLSIGSGFTD